VTLKFLETVSIITLVYIRNKFVSLCIVVYDFYVILQNQLLDASDLIGEINGFEDSIRQC